MLSLVSYVIKSLFLSAVTKIPDNIKLVIASVIIAGVCLIVNRTFTSQEVRAYVDPIQSSNEKNFTLIIKHNDNQFNLLRDDIRAVREQNSKILEKL